MATATLTKDGTVYAADRADRYLTYLEGEWGGVPALAQEWSDLDPLDQEVICLEWGIPEDRLAYLREWAAHGLLTPRQMARFRALLALVQRYRPTLERLFAEDEPMEERKAA